MKQKNSKRTLILPGLIVTAITIALFLSAAELLLIALDYPSRIHPSPFAHSLLGTTVPTNLTVPLENPDYFASGGNFKLKRSNNLSFFEAKDTSPLPAPGVYRIGVVGDSHTACECGAPESYAHVAQRILNGEKDAGTYEVLNAGVGRYSPYQYYLRSKLYLLPVKPRHIVAAIYIGNDLTDLTRQDDRPFLTVRSDGTFSSHPPVFLIYRDPDKPLPFLDSTRLSKLAEDALGESLFYQTSRVRMLLMNAFATGHGASDVFRYMAAVKSLTDISHGLMTQSLHQFTWFHYFPNTLAPTLKINGEVMRLFKEMCDAHNIRLTFLIIPAKIQIEMEDMREVLQRIQQYDPAISPERQLQFSDMYAEEIKKAGAALGVQVIDPRPAMKARKHGKRLYFDHDMHLSLEGNRALGEILAAHLGDPAASR